MYTYFLWKSQDQKMFVQSLHSVRIQWYNVLPACQHMFFHTSTHSSHADITHHQRSQSQFRGCILRRLHLKADCITAVRRRLSQFEGSSKCVIHFYCNESYNRLILHGLAYPRIHCAAGMTGFFEWNCRTTLLNF